MFVLLSKLIPPLFYPLGLTCVLLGLSLFFWWKRPKVAGSLVITALGILLLASSPWVSEALARSLELQNHPQTIPKAEAIVILGGGTSSAIPPRYWVEIADAGDRILYGAKLYREGKAPWVIVSGGAISWINSAEPESNAMLELLTTMGVRKSAILADSVSQNTYENAVYVKKILEKQGIHKILLVTSAMHMPRSLLIFHKLGIDAFPVPTDFRAVDLSPDNFSLAGILLRCLPDSEKLDLFCHALKEYVGILVYRLQGWA